MTKRLKNHQRLVATAAPASAEPLIWRALEGSKAQLSTITDPLSPIYAHRWPYIGEGRYSLKSKKVEIRIQGLLEETGRATSIQWEIKWRPT